LVPRGPLPRVGRFASAPSSLDLVIGAGHAVTASSLRNRSQKSCHGVRPTTSAAPTSAAPLRRGSLSFLTLVATLLSWSERPLTRSYRTSET
jgi:hypothetical protein